MLCVLWSDPSLIECLPVNIDEGLAVHAVDVEDPIQVVHLVLDNSSWPAIGFPCNPFTLLVQTCRVTMETDKKNVQKCFRRMALLILFS